MSTPTEPFPRVTNPDQTKPLFVSDLVRHLQSMLDQYGDLPVYVYSTKWEESLPMIEGCVHRNFPGKTIVISPTTETVNREMYYDLVIATRNVEVQP